MNTEPITFYEIYNILFQVFLFVAINAIFIMFLLKIDSLFKGIYAKWKNSARPKHPFVPPSK